MVTTRGKQAVRYGLGVHVGELGGLFFVYQVWKQPHRKRLAQFSQKLRYRFPVKRHNNRVANDVGEPGKALRELLRAGDTLRLVPEEIKYKVAELAFGVIFQNYAVVFADVGNAERIPAFAIDVPAKL